MASKRHIYTLLLLLAHGNIFSQVKVGDNATIVNPNAVFEIESNNKGFLLPRLALMATTNPYPLGAFTAGMLVYDTATAGDITPGLYYCDGTKWVKVNSGEASNGTGGDNNWSRNGNTGTIPGTNFIGTLDEKDMVFKTNGTERLRLTKDGWIGIGTTTPQAALHVKGQVVIDSLQAGNLSTDSVLVVSADGRIKAVNGNQLYSGMKRVATTVAHMGQTNFTTPADITDGDRIMLYRNGVLIDFRVKSKNLIVSEVACVPGDEIKIIQFL